MTSLSLDALLEAYHFTSWDAGDNVAYVCRRTGEIHLFAPELDLDEAPENVDDPELYAVVPDQRELDLGKRLVYDFAAEEAPDLHDRIAKIFRSPGAYGRFKDLLHREELLEDWYAYEANRVEQALRAWGDKEGLELTEGATRVIARPFGAASKKRVSPSHPSGEDAPTRASDRALRSRRSSTPDSSPE